jgi:hypothetical protein
MIRSIKIISAVCVLLLSCEDRLDQDMNPPVFEMTAPQFGDQLWHRDSSLHIKGQVSDESGVAAVRLYIHSGLDGHSHARQNFIQWSYEAIWEYATESLVAVDVNVPFPPNMLGGPYHVELHAVDQWGNVTSFADASSLAKQVLIIRDDQAAITISDFIYANNQLSINGLVTPQGHAIDFVAITIGTYTAHLGYLAEEELLITRYFGQSKHLSTPRGILVSGDELIKENDGSIKIERILVYEPLAVNVNEVLQLKIVAEDAIGSVSIWQVRINPSL